MVNGEESNMKKLDSKQEDELRPEYDLFLLLKNAVRGKYAERFKQSTNLPIFISDEAETQPTQKS